MYSAETTYLVRKEYYEDLRREAARERLVQLVMLRRADKRTRRHKITAWIHRHLLKWGMKMQYSTASSSADIDRPSTINALYSKK